MVKGEPGSPEWWRSPAFAPQGPADTILRLLEQEEISRCKARELLAYLSVASHYDLRAEPAPPPPPAPWIKLNWCDDLPNITVREACRRRMELGGADAQALEHALTMTETERETARRIAVRLRDAAQRLLAFGFGDGGPVEEQARAIDLESAIAEANVLLAARLRTHSKQPKITGA